MADALLGPAEIRELAARLGVAPTKKLGQNFLHDPNTIRRIVAAAGLHRRRRGARGRPGTGLAHPGPGRRGRHVHAVEIDPVLAGAPCRRPCAGRRNLTVHPPTRCGSRAAELDPAPTMLVANLPYNVAVPVVLHLLAELPTLRGGLVMVQKEVADRLVAGPGSKVYGVPSVKLAWYAEARAAGKVPPAVFWPVPNVDSGLVAFTRREPPPPGASTAGGVRGGRRGVRAAPQDAAGGAGRLGRRRGPGREGPGRGRGQPAGPRRGADRRTVRRDRRGRGNAVGARR